VSKERAQRRAVRLAESQAKRRDAERRAERRAAQGARRRALRDRLPRRGRVGRIAGRRSRAQMAGVFLVLMTTSLLVWYFVESWPVRIAMAILSLVAVPALVTLTLDRSTR
jgi:hypothetical protein